MNLAFGALQLVLLPELAVWIPDERVVLLSDVHLGKGAFFRQHGLAVPDGAFADDLQRLTDLVQQTGADLCVVGDLVHAGHNQEWSRFAEVRSTWQVNVTLVAGNHDTYARTHAEALGLTVVDHLVLGDVLLQHHPNEHWAVSECSHRICGHRHPSVTLNGPARQSVRSRCFHLQVTPESSTLILPGFGRFTGTHPIDWQPDDRVFIPAGRSVVEVPRALSLR